MTDFLDTFKRREIYSFAKGLAYAFVAAEYEGVIREGTELESGVVCYLGEEMVRMTMEVLDDANNEGTTYPFPSWPFNLSEMTNEEFIRDHRRILFEMMHCIIQYPEFEQRCITAFTCMISEQCK